TAADPWIGRSVPYLLFYPAVMIASWLGGFWPGVFATLLSGAAALFAFIRPIGTFRIDEPGAGAALLLFTINGIIVARLGEYMRRAVLDQRRLASIVETSDDAIVSNTLDGLISSWNRGAERLWGYTAAEAIGKPITIIAPKELWDEERLLLHNVRARRRVEPFETRRLGKDGTIVPVSMSASPTVDPWGAVVGASKIGRDVGDRLHAERLRDDLIARERVSHDEAVAARDRLAFLADVGTLLNSSLDYAETLDRAVHLALPRLGDYCNVLVQDEHGELKQAAWGHVVRDKEAILREFSVRVLAVPSRLGFPTFSELIMTSGKTLVVDSATLQARTARLGSAAPPDLMRLGMELRPFAFVGAP